GELPVFVNTLEPGSLSITKKISDESEEYDPDQEFVFHVKLIGEDVEEDAVYEYTIVKEGSQGNGGSGDTGEGNGSESGTGNENGTGDGTGSGGDSQPLLANPFPLIVRNGFNGPLKEGDSEEEKAYAIQSGQYFIFFTSKTVPTSPVTLTVDGVTKDYSGTIYSDFLSSKTWGNLTGVKYVDVDDNSVIKPTSMSSWFQRWSGLVSVDLTGFKTESPIALDSLFSLCSNLKTVTFDEKLKVSSTYNMFYACYGLVSLDLSTLNTTAITNMDSMFKSCRLLESIKFGDKFSTDNVVTMASMFNDCQKLKTLDLSSFNTASVESMESMFYWCFALESIKFGKNFNTAKVEKMSQMFDTCSSLKSLDLSGFSTASISGTNMTSMFRSCTSLETVVFGNEFTVENVTDLSSLFGGCSSLKTLDLTTFKTANVTNMGLMFSSCSSLKSLTLGTYFNTENVMYMASMFSGCSSLETLDLSVFKTPKVRETAGMFRDCSSLKTLDIRNFSITAYMMNMNNMFAGCNALSSISLGSDFSFKPPYYEGRYAILPTPTASGCTGKWINTDTLIAKTAEELKDEYGNDTITWAGTWIWERNAAYTIHFTVAEEDLPVAGLMSDVTTDFDVECKLPANEFQKDKYRFVNWIEASVINSSGTEVGQQREYTDRATIPVNTYNIGDKVTLQAVFAHNTVSVKDGEFEIILHGDETAIIDGLPAGTSYQIWEETPDGWILIEEKNSSGKIIEMETQEAEFTNLYQPKMTAVRFHGTKMLDNTVAEAGKYTFELYEVVDGKRVLLETVETMNGGFIQFKRIDYTKDDVGTHTYIIKETGFTDDSIEYDTHEETVTVVVSESEDMLISRVTYDDDGISFINKKRPGALRLTKIGEGVNEANEDDEFTFKITFRNESGMPIDDKIYWYIENEDGTIEVPTETGTSGGAGGEALPLLSNPLPLGLLKNGIGPMKEDDDDEVSTWFHATSDMLEGTAYAIYTSNRELIFFRSKGTYSNGANTTVTDIKGNTYSGTVYTGIETNSRNGAFNTNVRSVRIADGQAIKPKDTRYWFYNCSNLTSVDLSRLDTSIDTTFQALFYGCTSLRSIDVSTWDTRKIETMDMMFRDCSSLESLDLSSFRTPNLRVLRWTFIFCRNLKSLDLSSFDTSKVVSFQSCFEGLTSLKSLDISNFDVSGAVQGNNYGSISASLYGVFKNSSALEYLDISGMTITNKSASMSDFFLSTRAISTIVLGPGYKFTGASNTNLPTPPSSSPYTGEWIRIDGAYGPCTPEILASKYKSEMAGTWVWQTDDTGSIVYFNAEGGYCSPTSTRAEFMNKKITMPDYPDVQKPGYTIGGWNTKEDGSGTSYDPGKTYTYSQIGTKIGETIVLYAQWNKGDNWKYTVRHYKEKLDGSDFDLAATEVKYAKAVPSEDDPDQLVAIVTPPVKTEYAAEGFYLPDPQTVSVNKNGTTFIDYYYSRGTYEIIFDGNGATSGGMENLKMNSGVAKNLPLNTYQKEGSIFIGWNTKADGTGDAYTDGQQVKNLTKEETITLYAQWLKNENDPLTPTFGVVYVTLKAGQTIVIPNLPNGTSYTIEETEIPDGWTLKKIEGAEGVIVSNHNAEAFATNTYKAKGEAYIVAHKKLIDGEIEEGQFSFELLDEDGEVLQTKSNGAIDENQYVYDENGNQIENPYYGYAVVYFDPISYDTTGTYTYTVQEVPGEDKNIEYDKNTFGVTVNVENGGNGRLDCEVIYKDENEPMFVNRYMPGSLKIYKEIVSGDDNQKFSFVVHLYDKDGEELEDKFIATIASEGGRSYDEEYKSGDTISMTPKETVEISSIPAGTTYTVEEVEIPKNWELVSSEDTAGTIVSNETAKIRFTNKHTVVLFGDLVIEKELDTWEDGSPVTFIFDVVVEKNGEIILADVYSLTYDGPGKKRIEIKDLPSDANVTVKEVYVGAGYKLSTDATVNVVIDPDRPENLASFTNTYDNKRKRGYGAQNTFTTEDGETWTWISDLEEGGEGHE
ncbi:MAG: BspA family leucine-rich repeat surface protein, partial [Erysipelotrichaceae bacterium]|nr:BspA family leucine-rich repeat surface protein [Erysipelotrichaceae bacterium]